MNEEQIDKVDIDVMSLMILSDNTEKSMEAGRHVQKTEDVRSSIAEATNAINEFFDKADDFDSTERLNAEESLLSISPQSLMTLLDNTREALESGNFSQDRENVRLAIGYAEKALGAYTVKEFCKESLEEGEITPSVSWHHKVVNTNPTGHVVLQDVVGANDDALMIKGSARLDIIRQVLNDKYTLVVPTNLLPENVNPYWGSAEIVEIAVTRDGKTTRVHFDDDEQFSDDLYGVQGPPADSIEVSVKVVRGETTETITKAVPYFFDWFHQDESDARFIRTQDCDITVREICNVARTIDVIRMSEMSVGIDILMAEHCERSYVELGRQVDNLLNDRDEYRGVGKEAIWNALWRAGLKPTDQETLDGVREFLAAASSEQEVEDSVLAW